MAGATTLRCERARQSASLALDGELSELETRLLERHVGECAACREWAASIEETAALVRAAPLEQPTEVFVPRRRVASPVRRRVAIAAVVAAAVLGTLLGALLGRPDESPKAPAPQLGFLDRGGRPSQQIRPGLVTPRPPAVEPENPPEEAV